MGGGTVPDPGHARRQHGTGPMNSSRRRLLMSVVSTMSECPHDRKEVTGFVARLAMSQSVPFENMTTFLVVAPRNMGGRNVNAVHPLRMYVVDPGLDLPWRTLNELYPALFPQLSHGLGRDHCRLMTISEGVLRLIMAVVNLLDQSRLRPRDGKRNLPD